jgi:hypothetical protein
VGGSGKHRARTPFRKILKTREQVELVLDERRQPARAEGGAR